MIVYNWLKIFTVSGGNTSRILDIVGYLTYRPLPKNDYDPIKQFSTVDWKGNSFLLNPEKVIYNRSRVDDTSLAEYVALASYRNLAEYEVTKRKSLFVSECPITIESLTENKLISLSDNEIFFCWEETAH